MASTLIDQENGRPVPAELSGVRASMGYLWRIVLATLVALCVSQVLNHAMMGERLVPHSAVEGVAQSEYLLLTFVSSLLVTAAIAYPVVFSSLRGLALVQVLAIAHFGLRHLLSIVEAAVFLPELSASEVGLDVFGGAIESVVWPVRKKMSHSSTEEICDTASEENASHERGAFRH